MNNLKLFFQVYLRPGASMSDIIDRGSWPFAVVLMAVVSVLFFASVNSRLHETYYLPVLSDFQTELSSDAAIADSQQRQAVADYNAAMQNRQPFPVLGDAFYSLFSFEPTGFIRPLIAISVFYIPILVFLISLFGNVEEYGNTLRREYGTLAACTLFAWAAAHLPFALIGAAVYSETVDPYSLFGFWLAGSLLFGVFMLFVLRTAFGISFRMAAALVGVSWVAFGIANFVFQYIPVWYFLSFIAFYAVVHFSSYFGRYREFRNSVLPKQNFKRLLQEIKINPSNADAHVQLALIYRRRHRHEKTLEHFRKALEVDPKEIDANYELGKLARQKSDLQTALDHFGIVVEQDDTHALNEIWREVGATYLEANMFADARRALERFIERRPFDAEGLYYLGKAMKADGGPDLARPVFAQAVESVRVSPAYRRKSIQRWSKLAEREM